MRKAIIRDVRTRMATLSDKKRIPEDMELFSMTQDDLADRVTWREEQVQDISIAANTAYEANEVHGSTVSWKSINKSKRRKGGRTEALPPSSVSDLLNTLQNTNNTVNAVLCSSEEKDLSVLRKENVSTSTRVIACTDLLDSPTQPFPDNVVPSAKDINSNLRLSQSLLEPVIHSQSTLQSNHKLTNALVAGLSSKTLMEPPKSSANFMRAESKETHKNIPIPVNVEIVATAPKLADGIASIEFKPNASANPIEEDLDFFLSEEDLLKIDQQVNETIALTQTQASFRPPTISCSQSITTAIISETDIDNIIVSDEDMALFDELERQALLVAATQESKPHNSFEPSVLVDHELAQKRKNLNPLYIRVVADTIQDIPQNFMKIITGKVLSPKDFYSLNETVSVELTEEWYYTSIKAGNIFHLINISHMHLDQASQSIFISYHPLKIGISNKAGLIVNLPDVYVSPSKIAESCTCNRRGVLKDKLSSFSAVSSPAVMGNVRHSFIELITEKILFILNSGKAYDESSVFQHLSEQYLAEIMRASIIENIEELYAIGTTDENVKKDLYSLVSPAIRWILTAVKEGAVALARKNAVVVGGDGDISRIEGINSVDCRLKEVVGVEESIQSPILGIKGQVDIIGGGVLTKVGSSFLKDTLGSEYLLPIELKTGKWRHSTSIAHRAQVILYILLLNLRQRSLASILPKNVKETEYGLLLYLSAEEIKVDLVCPPWTEIRALMMSRNALAFSMHNSVYSEIEPRLPPLIRSNFDCTYCYNASECMAYHAAQEDGNEESSGVASIFSYVLKGIYARHLQYLKHWDRLLDLELMASEKDSTNMWQTSARAREENGDRCVSALILESFQSQMQVGEEIITVKFRKHNSQEDSSNNIIIDTRSFLVVGDRVLISLEKGTQWQSLSGSGSESAPNRSDVDALNANISSATITSIDGSGIQLSLSQGARAFKEMLRRISIQALQDAVAKGWTFRLDKDEGNITIATMRTNLMDLFVEPFIPSLYVTASTGRSIPKKKDSTDESSTSDWALQQQVLNAAHRQKTRELIVDLRSPVFKPIGPGEDDLHLFTPHTMSFVTYRQALDLLKAHNANIKQFDLRGKQPVPLSIQHGPGGQLIVPGGLVVYPGCHPFRLFEEFRALNEGQRHAIRKILTAQDFALLWGLPGTGKTNTLSLAIRIMIARGETVLLTSYTHNAVDHLLMKLVEKGISIQNVLRLGSAMSVNERCRSFCLDTSKVSGIAYIRKRMESTRLFAATVLSASRSKLLKTLKLDWCVMDEAGQMTQPAALGALMRAHRFVLVGDDCQLPPLVVSKEAQKQGMDVSMLKRLMDAHPHAVSPLTAQYRMNEDIMSLCNVLVYGNRMTCGSSVVAQSRLTLPGLQLLQRPLSSHIGNDGPIARNDWLFMAVNPLQPVVFLNTDKLPSHDSFSASSLGGGGGGGVKIHRPTTKRGDSASIVNSQQENIIDAKVIITILQGLEGCRLPAESDVAVITPFRAQMRLLQQLLTAKAAGSSTRQFEVSTVDRYQGKDRDVVIFSTVRRNTGGDSSNGSNSEGSVGQLLKDWRRINVALTRAKTKLIIVGSVSMMQQDPMLKALCDFVAQRRWVVDLPSDALAMYPELSNNKVSDLLQYAATANAAATGLIRPADSSKPSLSHAGILPSYSYPYATQQK